MSDPSAGLVLFRDLPDQHDFWRACGIRTIQLFDTSFLRTGEGMTKYLAELARAVERLQRSGFEVQLLLASNLKQWKGPEPMLFANPAKQRFSLKDEELIKERLKNICRVVQAVPADGHVLLAGEDGGGMPLLTQESQGRRWVAFAKLVRNAIQHYAPGKPFSLNFWCASQQEHNFSAHTSMFWEVETVYTRLMLAQPHLLDGPTGVQLPCHDLYRPLALHHYAKAGITPEGFPTVKEVEELESKGSEVTACCRYLLDQVDDGTYGDEPLNLYAQNNTLCIHRLVQQLAARGIRRAAGDCTFHGRLSRAINVYAFGTFMQYPSLPPAYALDSYAALNATADTALHLRRVLEYLECHGVFASYLPEDLRPRLEDAPSCAAQALEELERVRPACAGTFPLPQPPEHWLFALRQTLEAFALSGK